MTAVGTTGVSQRSLVRRALAGHTSLGLLAAALMYVIALTGTLAMFHDRWQRWERPDLPEYASLPPAAVTVAMKAALASGQGKSRITHVAVQLPTDDLPRATVSTDGGSWHVDATGRLVGGAEPGWADFVATLHETLLLPSLWGYWLVGALGVVLAALAATGVLAHPRIVRDAFRLRWRQGPHIARVDWHNRLGVWTLPFTLAIALTGAVLGLGSIAASLLASAYYHGSVEQAYAPIFGRAPPIQGAAGQIADAAAAMIALRAIAPSARPTSLTVQGPGTSGQTIQIIATHPQRLIYGESYWFDARGRPLGKAGLADGALGQQAAASVYGLHFGNYGGLAVELAYQLFGLALCAITATGPSIWLRKRCRRGVASPCLVACWDVVVWGTPLLLILAAWLRFAGGAGAQLSLLFWGGMGAFLLAATARPAWVNRAHGRTVVFGTLATTGLGHVLLFLPNALSVQMIDLVAVFVGACALGVSNYISGKTSSS